MAQSCATVLPCKLRKKGVSNFFFVTREAREGSLATKFCSTKSGRLWKLGLVVKLFLCRNGKMRLTTDHEADNFSSESPGGFRPCKEKEESPLTTCV